MSQWKFTSDDGRFEMDFTPVIDRSELADYKLLNLNRHQVFGYYNGTVILDDGKSLLVKDMFGFAEKVQNKW